MNCQKFESVASELARGQMMEVDLRDEAMAHSESCADCASHLHGAESLTRELRSLAAEMNSLEAPAALEASLLSSFRQQQVVVVPMPVRRDYRRYWLAAVAALILIVFSVVAVRVQLENRQVAPPNQVKSGKPKQEPKKEDPQPQLAKDETPQPEPAPVSLPQRRPKGQRTINSDSLQARHGSRNKNNNTVANHASNEVATEFMPLGYLNAEAVQDGGQILRVELPRTALVKFGLPVNMERSNERVKADILVGIDGMAHAIRFVQDRRVQ
jgi:hypothetical protein